MKSFSFAGVHKVLKDKDTSWSEKILVAKVAWTSNQCHITINKEQVLLEWVSTSLVNAKK